jgi:hypothetical protein
MFVCLHNAECRRRKKEHVLELQKQVARMEAENLKLKLQLKVGEESEAQEREEKERITKKLDEMVRALAPPAYVWGVADPEGPRCVCVVCGMRQVKSGASEQDIWQTIDMFKDRYSDYGSDRRSAIEFHINQLEKVRCRRLCVVCCRRY